MKRIIFILSFFVIPIVSQKTIMYVRQTVTDSYDPYVEVGVDGYPVDSGDGSESHPFSYLASAFGAVNSSITEIVLLGESYTVKISETYNNLMTSGVAISIRVQNPFILRFRNNGMIYCSRKNANYLTNIEVKFIGFTIEVDEDLTSFAIFQGNCDYTFQDIFIDQLNSNFMSMRAKWTPSIQFRNLTVNNIVKGTTISFGTLIFDQVYLKGSKDSDTAHIIHLEFPKIIQITNSIFDRVQFKAIGNNGDLFKTQNTTFCRERQIINSFLAILFEDTVFDDADFQVRTTRKLAKVEITFNRCIFQNIVRRYDTDIGIMDLSGLYFGIIQNKFLNLSILNSKFYNNMAPGGIVSFYGFENKNINIINSHFRYNVATSKGGVLACLRREANFVLFVGNSIFDSNSAPYGGVFSFFFGDQYGVTLKNSTFINNTANYGAIFAVQNSQGGGDISMGDCNFSSNLASDGGGIIHIGSGNILMNLYSERNTFEQNSALNGAVYHFQPESQLNLVSQNDTYLSNEAQFGAVISIRNSDGAKKIIIRNSIFDSNAATEGGGVIYVESGESKVSLTFETNFFSSNSALGGGVFSLQPVNELHVAISNETYINNTAKYGAVLSAQGQTEPRSQFDFDILIKDSKFLNNNASVLGGAFAFSAVDKGILTVLGSEFKLNVAEKRKGGVMHFEKGEVGTIITFENNIFEYNSAISGGVLNFESLSQVQMILQNNTFNNNVAAIGAVIAFQSSRKTGLHLDINVLISDSKFYNNIASNSGGVLAFIMIERSNVSIRHSHFENNNAVTAGGVIYVTQGKTGLIMNFEQNFFGSNSAFTGGVFDFEAVNKTQVLLSNNIYAQNFVTFGGGVGYLTNCNMILRDFNSSVIGNSAEIEGGGWSIKGNSANTTFENITFDSTSAKARGDLFRFQYLYDSGGCIYNSASSSLILENTLFINCSAYEKGSLGGAIYTTGNSTIQARSLSFINNQAEFGASIATESAQEEQSYNFRDINFRFDVPKINIRQTIKSQVQSATGAVFKNVSASVLETPFISHLEGTLEIEDITIQNMKCDADDSSVAFCLFSLSKNKIRDIFFNLKRLNVKDVSSKVPLIFSKASSLSLNLLKISNILSTSKISVASFEESTINIDTINLSNITSNFIQTSRDSVLNISNAVFDNQAIRNREFPTQFIILSESSIRINSSIFQFNAVSYPQKGGTLQLTNAKSIKIRNSSFYENKANNGGALFIEGSVFETNISNCTFISNTVPKEISDDSGFGGAIYMQSISTDSSSRLIEQTTDSVFVIENSVFKENSAFNGGAIYNKEVSFSLQNSIFDANQATSGGGLAINIDNPSLSVDIVQTRFENNIGSVYGASIMQLRKDVIRNRTGTIFTNETQKFERGVPAKLRIRTFLYDDQVQFLINSLNITELENMGHLALEYDSFYNQNIKLNNLKGGRALDRLIEVTVYDSQGSLLTELQSEDGQASLNILNTIYPSRSLNNVSSIAGTASKGLTNGSIIFFQETSFFAFPESLLDIQVSMLITHRNLGNLKYVLNSTFQVQLSNCVIGEIFNEETLICDSCKPNYFSLTDPFKTSVCQKCDVTKADCPGGSLIYPKPGYWRLAPMSDNLVACPFPEACMGARVGDIMGKEVLSLTGFCNTIDGYEGNACSTCKTGFAKYQNGNNCVNCREDTNYYIRLVGLLTLQIGIMIFNIYSNLLPPATNEDARSKETLDLVQGTIIKIVVDYIQIFGMFSSLEMSLPESLGNFGSVISKSVPSSKDVFTVDCFFSLAQGSNQNVFFYKLLILNFQPFVFFIFGMLFWIIFTKFIRRKNLKNNPQFRNNLLVTNCFIAYLLQPEILKSTFQLFKCQNLGSLSDSQEFLEQDLEIRCGGTKHLAWVVGVGVPALLFWFILPVIIFIRIMFKVKDLNKSKETLQRYHFVFRRYKEDKIYWDVIILLRKTVLIFILVFLNNLYKQVFISLAVCQVSLYLHYNTKPYTETFDITNLSKLNFSLNDLETLGLISSCFLLFGGLFFIENKQFGAMHVVLMSIIFSCNLLLFCRIAKAFYWVLLNKAKKLLKKNKQVEIHITTNENEPESPKMQIKVTVADEENKELLTPK